jgi:hypothetical protein
MRSELIKHTVSVQMVWVHENLNANGRGWKDKNGGIRGTIGAHDASDRGLGG